VCQRDLKTLKTLNDSAFLFFGNKMPKKISISDLIDQVARQFAEADLYYGHGTANELDEAAWAVHHVLDIPFGVDETDYRQTVSSAALKAVQALVEQRIRTRKPMAYLTKKMWFANIEFYVDERTLVPRSPIAELIQTEFTPWVDMSKVRTALDLCTGSGCIGLALAAYYPDVTVTCSDISKEALQVAEINRKNLHLEEQVTLVESDLYKNLTDCSFDLIVSNPPYVAQAVVDELPEEYQQEPDLGLASGDDGLKHVEIILKEAVQYLSEHGVLIVEVGLSEEALCQAHPQLGFVWLDFERGGEGVFMLTAQQLREYYPSI